MSREVSRAERRRRRAAGEDVLVVDVRAPEEFAASHIEGAVNVPLEEIEADPSRLPLGRSLVCVCGKGGGRSERAARALQEARAVDVGFLEGGTLAWLAER